MTDRVQGGSTTVVYDVSGIEGWTSQGGSALPVYITGTGEINGSIVVPFIPSEFPPDSLQVNSFDWLAVNAVDHLIVQ